MVNAIEKVKGPCVILAGAGTGKTHTIVEKIKYLISNKIYDPKRIVCITFSNEAANSLLLRVQKAVGLDKEPIVRTFHAFSADLLKNYGEKIGIKQDFKILTPDEAKVVLHRNFKITPYNCHKYIASIGTAKDLGLSVDDLKQHSDNLLKQFEGIDLEKRLENLNFELQTLHLRNNFKEKSALLAEIKKVSSAVELKKFVNAWNAYEKIKFLRNYQDYSDLNKNALSLLQKYPEIANNFDYIVVDEFQDTNKVQLDFLIALALHGNITIVGDLNQSIYRFRGAYKENFHLFKNHFNVKDSEIFALDKSFRSSNKILRNAHKLISNNYTNKEECFIVENAHGREGDKIEIYELKNAREEARKVTELINKELAAGTDYNDICVMFRTHQQGRVIKKLLEMNNIPYSSVSKNSLLKHGSVRVAVDYLTILNKLIRKEKGEEQAWWDLIYTLKFSESDLIKIGKFIKENKESEDLSEKLLKSLFDLSLSEQGKMSFKVLADRINLMLAFVEKEKEISKLIPEIYRMAGLINENRTREDKEISLNLNKFLELAQSHANLYAPDLSSFLHYLDILQNLDIEIEASELERYGVQLMTSHSTKGLEYKTVIITNMAQKRFPIEKYTSNSLIPVELYPELKDIAKLSEDEKEYYVKDYEKQNQILDERRLCYVSFTRAKEKLILTYAQEYANKKAYPSQFLQEIDYKKNSDAAFSIDLEEKYAVSELQIKKASEVVLGEEVKKTIEKRAFSPSALLTFAECQKEFEYKYVYNMPDRKTLSWDALRLGSFVHIVLERGVKNNFRNLEDFLNLAKELHLEEDWQSVNFSEAEHMLKIFYERNKSKYNEKSKTEQELRANISGLHFIGFADRIDFSDKGLEIIDYKTGRSQITPRHREWQLGYYALAASSLGKVHKITLDMLKQEKPIEFEIDDKGNAVSVNSDLWFNINKVEEELVDTAKQIVNAYKAGFKPCPIEKNCEFCGEYVYEL